MAAEVDVRPESHEVWATTSKNLLGSAQVATSELLIALEGTEHVHADCPKLGNNGRPRNVDRGPKNQKKLDDRLEVTKIALNTAEASGQRCSQILQLLQHERQAKWAALKVVEWRLALRERRPKTELFRDHLQEALEQEKQTLEESRKILADRATEVRISAEDCEANRVRLMDNVRHMICRGDSCPPLAGTSKGLPGSLTSPPLEAELNVSEEVAAEAASERSLFKRPVVPADNDGLIQRAPQLHEISMQLYFKGEKLIQTQKVICDKANEKVMASFRKRSAENKELRDGLEAQIQQMDEAIAAADKSMSRMQKDIDFFGKVALQPKVDSTSALVAKIQASKQELADDLLRKVVSIRIDDCCRKITPERTGQAPESMPVAALLEPPPPKAKMKGMQKKLGRTESSPAFVNGNNIDSAASTVLSNAPAVDSLASTASTVQGRHGSPAGLSSSLKAGAAASFAQ